MFNASTSSVAAAILYLASVTAVIADEPSTASLWSAGPAIGTLGVGGEVSYLVYKYVVFRANGSYLKFNYNDTITAYGAKNSNYNFDMSGIFAGGIVDIHPFESGWRVSAGLRYVDAELKDIATNGQTLGSTTYTPAQVGTVTTTIHNTNPGAPYLGFGYDASHFSKDGAGFKLGLDVGALYAGDPDVSIKTTLNPGTAGFSSDVAAETSSLKDSLRKWYNFYPVAMVSGRISF